MWATLPNIGVVIIRGAKFKCSIDKAKRPFYRAANGIFAKIGRLASEEVMVQLLKQKCLPILLYALDVCNLDKRSMQSLDFTHSIDFFMKLFKTSNGNCELLSKTVRLWPTKHIIETALWKMYCYFVTLFFCCTQLSLLVKVFFILYCTTFMVNKDEYIYCVEWPIEWSFSITQHVNDLDDTTWTPKYLTFSHQTISRLSEVSKLLHGCLYREPNLVQTDFWR